MRASSPGGFSLETSLATFTVTCQWAGQGWQRDVVIRPEGAKVQGPLRTVGLGQGGLVGGLCFESAPS